MKSRVRVLALLLCLGIMVFALSTVVLAGTPDDFTLTVDKTSVEKGDTVTVAISNKETAFSAMTLVMKFDNSILQCTGLTNVDGDDGDDDLFMHYLNNKGKKKDQYPSAGYCTVEAINGNSQFQFLILLTEDQNYVAGDVVVFTFEAINEGTVDLSLKTTVVDKNGENAKTVTETITVANGETEHTCVDTNPKDHICDNGCDVPQGEHKSNAAHPCLDGTCEYCGKPVAATAQHTGGTATCKEKAKCTECGTAYGNVANHYDGDDEDHLCDFGCGEVADDGHHGGNATCLAKAVCDECGESYGELGGHNYGDLIPAKDAVHEQDKLEPGVAAHYQCSVCEKYFTEDEKKETLPEDLIGETPKHTPGEPVKNEDLSTDPTCTEEGTEVSETFCTVCGKLLDTDSVKVPVKTDCTVDRATVTYQWTGTDSCVAQGTCQYGKVHKAEAVITSEVTVEADCVTEQVITYTATFDVDWAEAQTETVTGYVDTTKHAVGAEMCYGPANGLDNESTHHGVYCDKCGEPWDAEKPDEPHVADENGYCDCGYFELIIDFNGGKISQTAPDGIDQTLWEKLVNEQLGGFDATQEIGFVNVAVSIPEPENYGFGFVKEGYRFVGLAYDAEGNQPYEREDIVEPTTLYMVWECTHDESVHEYTYTDNKDGATHTVKCACGETIDADEAHDYTTGASAHTCACEAVETFEVSVTDIHGNSVIADVPYGTNILAFLEQKVTEGKLSTAPNVLNDPTYKIGTDHFVNWVDTNSEPIAADAIVTKDMYIGTTVRFVGWFISDQEWRYANGDGYLKGWNEIDDAWYYFDKETSVRAEGATRVPYPTEAINGITYGPNAEDKAYWEAHKDTSMYSDAETAIFIFDENGKFQQTTGIVGNRYAANGMIGWHPGMVEVDGECYYFIGDKNGGGNIAANGDTNVTRPNGYNDFKSGDVYNFDNGKLSGAHGVVDGKYYENSKLMRGNGLTKVGDKYIYVCSSGELVVGTSHWVPANSLKIVAGMYEFDADGYMINPVSTEKNGIVEEDGALYYYENGKRCYAGLIEIDGDMYYIRSNGQVATGEYYVTKSNVDTTDIAPGTKLIFDEDGKMMPIKNGIVAEEKGLFYYQNNKLMKGAGLVKIGDDMYYIRSNGQVATGEYYVTKVNDTGIDKGTKLVFGEDGKMEPMKNGIVAEEKGLFYYKNNKLMKGAGVVELTDENGVTFYIYVRSNGQLATGIYWPSIRNDLLPRGAYNWGTNGRYYPG